MARRFISFGLLLLCAALASRLPATRTAHAADYWDVEAGGEVSPGVTSYAFWPAAITIHAGDTVRWSLFATIERHTVTFTPDGGRLALYVPGPGNGELTLGPAWYPAGPAIPDGSFDPTRTFSSGALFGGTTEYYKLTFPKEGTFSYACELHDGMQGTITVVSDDATLDETPAQAWTRGQAALNDAADALDAQIAQLGAGAIASTDEGAGAGDATAEPQQSVSAGLSDTNRTAALQFLPGDLTVRRGDTVRWTNGSAFSAHTVSFTSGDAPPDFPTVRGSGVAQLVLSAAIAQPAGGDRYSGRGYLNSGLLQPGASVTFTIDAPPGTYTYLCLLHRETMHGTITVLPGDAGGTPQQGRNAR